MKFKIRAEVNEDQAWRSSVYLGGNRIWSSFCLFDQKKDALAYGRETVEHSLSSLFQAFK